VCRSTGLFTRLSRTNRETSFEEWCIQEDALASSFWWQAECRGLAVRQGSNVGCHHSDRCLGSWIARLTSFFAFCVLVLCEATCCVVLISDRLSGASGWYFRCKQLCLYVQPHVVLKYDGFLLNMFTLFNEYNTKVRWANRYLLIIVIVWWTYAHIP